MIVVYWTHRGSTSVFVWYKCFIYSNIVFIFFLFINVYDRTISEAKGEVGYPLNRFKPPSNILYYRPVRCGASDLVICVWLFWCKFLYCFHFLCV